MGLLPLSSGQISLGEDDISTLPAHDVPRRGVGYIPQGRRLFAALSVDENIQIGLMTRGKGKDTRERVLNMFPRMRERLTQRAETLSGESNKCLPPPARFVLNPRCSC